MAEKAKAEGNNFVKKLLSSNLTWSIVAFILLVIICTIFQHDFLALSWNSNTGGLAGPLITMRQESARYLMIATGMTLVIYSITAINTKMPYLIQPSPTSSVSRPKTELSPSMTKNSL